MTETRSTDYWREAQGGFRGSHLLLGGAVLLAVGAVVSLVSGFVGAAAGPGIVEIGWLAYILGLLLAGLGFGWSGAAGVLPRAALGAAALHLAQSAYLLYILYGRSQPPVSPVALTVGRHVALLLFVAMAARPLGPGPVRALGAAAGLGLAKTLARVLVPAADGGIVLDATLLLFMAAAIGVTTRRLRGLEDEWAREHHPGRRTDFSEFNNPEHDWNRPDDRP